MWPKRAIFSKCACVGGVRAGGKGQASAQDATGVPASLNPSPHVKQVRACARALLVCLRGRVRVRVASRCTCGEAAFMQALQDFALCPQSTGGPLDLQVQRAKAVPAPGLIWAMCWMASPACVFHAFLRP